jgi:hypothetical protein
MKKKPLERKLKREKHKKKAWEKSKQKAKQKKTETRKPYFSKTDSPNGNLCSADGTGKT